MAAGARKSTRGTAMNMTTMDTGTNTTITLSVPVSPTSVTFNNSSVDYTINGTGAINGVAQLVKSGSRTVTWQ